MFISELTLADSRCKSSLWNLSLRFSVQAFILLTIFLFSLKQNLITSLLFASVMIYFYLNNKFSFVDLEQLRQYRSRERTFFIELVKKEHSAILLMLIICCASLMAKAATHVRNSFAHSHSDLEDYIEGIFFLYEKDSSLDTILLFSYTFVTAIVYKVTRSNPIFFDPNMVKIYLSIFTKSMKAFLFVAIVISIIISKINFFQISYVGIIENIAIIVIFIVIFDKVSRGNYDVLRRYINILKYIAILKIISILVFWNLFFSSTSIIAFKNIIDPGLLKRICHEIYSEQNINDPSFFLLIGQYLLFNYFNFLCKFRSYFKPLSQRNQFPELIENSLKVNFIQYFAKELPFIMSMSPIEAHIDHSLHPKKKYWKDFESIAYFKKNYENTVKAELDLLEKSTKFSLIEFFKKNKNILILYRKQLLNHVITALYLFFLTTQIIKVNFFSMFYLSMCILILNFQSKSLLRKSNAILCIAPNLAALMLYALLFIGGDVSTLWNLIDFFRPVLKKFGFMYINSVLDVHVKNHFFALFVSVAYIWAFMLIEKSNQIMSGGSVDYMLKKRMQMLDADEDLMYFLKVIFNIGIVCLKYFTIYLMLSDCLDHVSLTNTIVLGFIFLHFFNNSKFSFECLVDTFQTVFVLRFFARYTNLFGEIEDHFKLLIGLFFERSENDNFNLIEDKAILTTSYIFKNMFLIYCLSIVRAMWNDAPNRRILENKVFKTQSLQDNYNYFLQFSKHLQNVIDSTKIFFVYIAVFYYAMKQSTSSMLGMMEFIYCSFLLILHMIIFKIKGNVRVRVFFIFFFFYLIFLLAVFIQTYILRFHLFISLKSQTKMRFEELIIRNQGEELMPLIIKIALTIISIKCIQVDFAVQSDEEPEESAQSLENKIYYKIIKVLAVFIKEALLIIIVLYFLKKPNFFKILYVLVYLLYFKSQIKALSEVVKSFRFLEILAAKIRFVKNYFFSSSSEELKNSDLIFSEEFKNMGDIYLNLFTRRMFHQVYEKVNQTWIWSFSLIIVNMEFIYMLSYIEYGLNSKYSKMFPLYILMNPDITPEELRDEMSKLFIVLIFTIFELYFINILKCEKLAHEDQLISLISNTFLAKFHAPLVKKSSIETPEARAHFQYFENLLKTYSKIKKKAFTSEPAFPSQQGEMFLLTARPHQFPRIPDTPQSLSFIPATPSKIFFSIQSPSGLGNPAGKGFEKDLMVESWNEKHTEFQKALLSQQNLFKLNLLYLAQGFIYLSIRLIMVPIALGILQSSQYSLFTFSVIGVIVFSNKPGFDKPLNRLNTMLVALCFIEYSLIYLFEQKLFSDVIHVSLSQMFLQLGSNPLSALPYIFFYTAMIKAFFLSILFLSKYCIVRSDRVDPSVFAAVRVKIKEQKRYWIIDYSSWKRGSYNLESLKGKLLDFAPDCFFILSLLAHSTSLGITSTLALLGLVGFRVYLFAVKRKRIAESLRPQFATFFKMMLYVKWIILVISQFGYVLQMLPFFSSLFGLSIQQPTVFAFSLSFNYIVIEILESPAALEHRKAYLDERSVMEELYNYNRIYNYNEQCLLNNIEASKVSSTLRANLDSPDSAESNSGQVDAYKEYLFSILGNFKFAYVSTVIWLRKKITQHIPCSSNSLSTVSCYLHKNRKFIGPKSIRLFPLMMGNFEELLDIIKFVKANNESLSQNIEYEEVFRERIREAETMTIKSRTRSINTPMTARRNRNFSFDTTDFLIKKLLQDNVLLEAENVGDNQFGNNIYKWKIEARTYLIIRQFDQISSDNRDPNLSLMNIRTLLCSVLDYVNAQGEFICCVVLICFLCFYGGFISVIPLGIVLFSALMETRVHNWGVWQIVELFFMAYMLIHVEVMKFNYFVPYDSPLKTGNVLPKDYFIKTFTFLYGQHPVGLILTAYLIVSSVAARMGKAKWNVPLAAVENPPQAIFRITFNGNWPELIARKFSILFSEILYIEHWAKKLKRESLREKEFIIFLVSLASKKAPLFHGLRSDFQRALPSIQNCFNVFRTDRKKFEPEKFRSYFWRNFSYVLRKPGDDFNNVINLSLLAILFYFIIFYYNLLGLKYSIYRLVEKNEVQGTLGINFTFFVLCICFNRYLYMSASRLWVENLEVEVDAIARRYPQATSSRKVARGPEAPLARFRRIARTLLTVIKMKRKSKIDTSFEIRHNSVLKRFYFTLFFWVYSVGLCFFWLPYLGRQALSEDTPINGLFCNDVFRTRENSREPAEPCNSFSQNIFLQVFFFLINVFTFLSILQIKRGFSTIAYFHKTNFSRVSEKLNFYFYKYAPYIRELRTIIDFMASSSVLNVFQWLKLEDIECTISAGKLAQANQRAATGSTSQTLASRKVGLAFLVLLLLLLIGPLYLFSDLFPTNIIDEVKAASLKIDAHLREGKGVCTVFETTSFNVEPVDRREAFSYLGKEREKLGDTTLYRKLTFKKNSNFFYLLSPETRSLFTNKESTDSQLTITLTITTLYKGKHTIRTTKKLDKKDSQLLREIIKSDGTKLAVKNRLNLDPISRLVVLPNMVRDQTETDPAILGQLKLDPVLRLDFDSNLQKMHFQLTDHLFNEISFFVIVGNIKNSVELLQRLWKDSNVSLMSIYVIIFSYIGFTVLRKALFDQSHMIWTKEIPNAHRLEERQNQLVFAQIKDQPDQEILIYSKLIDLFRAPEELKKLTGYLDIG